MKTERRFVWLLAALAALSLSAPPAFAATKKEEAQKLMKVLRDSRDPEERRSAASRLGSMGATDAGPALGMALKDSDVRVRLAATIALGDLKEAARGQEQALREAMKPSFRSGGGSQPWVALNAGGVLEGLGVPREEMVDDLRAILDSADLSARVEAASRLRGLVDGKLLMPVALEGVESEDSDVRSTARSLLSALKPKGDEAAAKFLELLRSRDSSLRSDAARRLGDLKPPPQAAFPELTRLLKSDPDQYVRIAAAGSLRRYGAAAVPPLLEALQKDEEVDVRTRAGDSLQDLGPVAKEAIPALIKLVKEDKEPKIRSVSCEALGEMREVAKSAIPVLNEALKDSDGFVRGAAWRALIRIDPKR